jgi:hypothetical protein
MAYELSALGITGIHKVADHLADFGRFGDGYVVHASKGETVIPLAVLKENPRLKTALFTQMREMGLDPNRYIVGDKLNSINPVTGQPEFFLKKLFKGIKNVVKAIAPVVLPVALSMTRLGPIFGAAAGTGIASLIGGASLGRSLKNSVIAGGIGGLYAGLTDARAASQAGTSKWEGFKSGVSKAFGQPFAARPPRTAALGDAVTAESELSPVDVSEYMTPGELRAASELSPITAAEASLPLGQLQPLGAYEPGDLQGYIGQPVQTPVRPFFEQLQGAQPVSTDGRVSFRTPDFDLSSVAQAQAPTVAPTGSLYAGQPFQPQLGLQPTSYEAQIGQFDAFSPASSRTSSLYSPEMGRRLPFQPSVPIASRPDLLQPVDPTNNIFRGTQLNAPTVGFTDVSAPVASSVSAPVASSVSAPVAPGRLNVTAGGAGDSGRGRFATARDYLVRGGQTPEDVLKVKKAAYDQVFLDTNGNKALAEAAYNAAGPGMLAKYGPSTALGLGAAGLFGAFDEGDEPEPVDFYAQAYGKEGSALERLRNNPGMFSVGVPTRAYTPATLEDIRYSAVGGPINQDNFPPRIGPINGAGTGTSDDVPAMLSDGEYVMTAKAVRGAGNGNRKQGMHNMYNMMRQFEGQAV